jgi:hypothetical protein
VNPDEDSDVEFVEQVQRSTMSIGRTLDMIEHAFVAQSAFMGVQIVLSIEARKAGSTLGFRWSSSWSRRTVGRSSRGRARREGASCA